MKNFRDLYIELSEKIATIEAVEWIDLWNSQVYNLDTERPVSGAGCFHGIPQQPNKRCRREKSACGHAGRRVFVF